MFIIMRRASNERRNPHPLSLLGFFWFATLLCGGFSPTTAAASEKKDDTPPQWFVSWNAPFLSGSSGYGSEATSFLAGLNETLSSSQKWRIGAGLTHGDSPDPEYVQNLPQDLEDLFEEAYGNQMKLLLAARGGGGGSDSLSPKRSIVVCHSEPGAWSVPEPLYDSGWPCPPPSSSSNEKWHALVGRTMFETDRLPRGWEKRLNRMDQVWVPTQHHKAIFEKAGVTKPVVVVGQGIDVGFWNPDRLTQDDKEFAKRWIEEHNNRQKEAAGHMYSPPKCSPDDYKFLSVFKWEARKGPEILLKSFYDAFPNGEGACLMIVTSLYHQDDGDTILAEVQKHWKTQQKAKDDRPPRGVALLSGLPLADLVKLYGSVDAFVLPSRGEGWGRPYMEAMAMGLPVLATDWSGPTEFVNEQNGYLIPIKGLVDAQLEAFPGHRWADPDGKELTRLMKRVQSDPEEARGKGERARKDVVEKWSNKALAKQVADLLEQLSASESSTKGPPSHDDEL